MTLAIVGLGHIGLPTAALLAKAGHQVVGVDTATAVVDAVNGGRSPMDEPGLDALIADLVAAGTLSAQTVMPEASVFLIAVPTPVSPSHEPDLSYVESAAESVAERLKPGDLVILESTVPPGTTTGVVRERLEAQGLKAGIDFDLAFCPERVLPGSVLDELVANDRTVGGLTPAGSARAAELYRSFCMGAIHVTDPTTAEVAKLSENTFRDVNIALANELAQMASQLNVDAWQVIELANRHPRVHLHSPGPGVGGHCVPVDPWFLVAAAPQSANLIRMAREINDAQPAVVAAHVARMTGTEAKVALLGAAYKPNVDDARESPTLGVALALEALGIVPVVHDPKVQSFARPLVTLEEALTGADAVVLLVGHHSYAELDPAWAGPLMRVRRVLDTQHLLDPAAWRNQGFEVQVLGTP